MNLNQAIKHCNNVIQNTTCLEYADDHRKVKNWLVKQKNKKKEKRNIS
jgi:hypothetical protein